MIISVNYHRTSEPNTGIYIFETEYPNEGHTIAQILTKELLPVTKHISYVEPHPLEKKIELMITSEEEHDKLLFYAIQQLQMKLKLIKKEFESTTL